MSNLRRLWEIFVVIGKYRLDQFIDKSIIPAKYRILFWPFSFFPDNSKSRGEKLRFALEELGPIFVKFGQILSTRPDILPDDIIEALSHLQDNVAPFDEKTFTEIVETSLKNKVGDLFVEFDRTPLASASVAQVHAAKLLTKKGVNGQEAETQDVVVKVIRPGIEKTIKKDTHLLLSIARLIEAVSAEGRRFKLIEVVEDYRSTIFDELDLSREAANASQLRRNFSNNKDLYIPEVFWDYTCKHVMTMERIYGIQVSDRQALEAQNTNFELLAKRGVEVFFTQVFEHNFFHADMHPGNVFISKVTPQDPSYLAVDFAIVGSLTKEDQYYLARNLLAMFRRDYRQVAELHVVSGWVPPDTSISGFESAIRSVCEPIFEKPLKDISFGEALINLFQTARRFNMPVQPQLVLLQKTLLNIEGLGRQLYPELDLWQTAHPYLEKWIRERYHPKTLLKQFKYESPDWLEKFPELPDLVFDTLEQVKYLGEAAPQIKQASEALTREKSETKSKKKRKILALTALASASYFAWPALGGIPTESILLLTISFMALIL